MEKLIYRCPGKVVIWGVPTEYKSVSKADAEKLIGEGWFGTCQEAQAAYKAIAEAVKAEVEAEKPEPIKAEESPRRGRPPGKK